jgi:hypothetical protein
LVAPPAPPAELVPNEYWPRLKEPSSSPEVR